MLYQKSDDNPYSKREIEKIGSFFSAQLPADYVDFVLEYGDIYFPDPRVTFDVSWKRVDGKALAANEDEDFEDEFMLLVFSGPTEINEDVNYLYAIGASYQPFLPKHFLPFTREPSGSFLLLSLASDDYGSIYLYAPSDDPWGEGENKYLGYIAPSFTDFIENKIRPYE